jgi:acyl-CoA hydrolase
VVTASVDHVSFHKPIPLGEIVTLEAKVTRAFNSSVEIFVEVFVSNIKGGNPRKSNHAYFTFVALDDETKKPTQVPAVIPLTADEEQLFESAARRREVRLVLSGRMKPTEAKVLKDYFDSM